MIRPEARLADAIVSMRNSLVDGVSRKDTRKD